jgi:hypothetical protein
MKKGTVGLMALVLLAVGLTPAHGDEFALTPSVAVRGEYDDNIFYTSEDEESDYILTITPGLELKERTERLKLKLSGEVAPFFYQDNTDLDEVDQDYRGRVDYQFTPRFNGRADVFYIVDHRPDRDTLTTGLVQNVDQRQRYHGGAGTEYLLSEKAAVDLSYDFNKDHWDSNADDREDLTSNTADVGFSYNLGRWFNETTGRLNFSYGNYDYESSKTKSYSGGIGIRHRLSEIFSLELYGGVRYADTDFDVVEGYALVPPGVIVPVIGEDNNTGWGGVGQAVLEYRGEKTVCNLLASHDIAAVSGRLGPSVLTRVVFSAYHRFLEKLRVGFTAGAYHNKADEGDFSTQEIDEYTFRIRPSIRWEFFNDFTLEGAYTFSHVDDRAADNDINKNAVYLQLAYGLPLFDFLDLFSSEGRQVVSGAVPVPSPR